MDHVLLASDIQSNATALAGKTAAQIADWYNTLSIATTQLVSIAVLQAYLQQSGIWLALMMGTTSTDANVKSASTLSLALGTARYDNIDLTLPLVGEMMSILLAASIITQDQHDSIFAMSNVNVSRWQSIFGVSESVTEYDILIAQGL